MLLIKKKYEGVTSLLAKDGKKWQIHHSIINEFFGTNKKKNSIETHCDWKSFTTWNPFANYDVDYHIELIKEIKSKLPANKINYTIEHDGRGFNHVHFISDASVAVMKKVVDEVILKYYEWYEIYYQVAEIKNKYSSKSYLHKAPIKIGTL